MRTRGLPAVAALAALAVVALLAIGVAGASAGSSRTFVASRCDNAAYKPGSVVLACGDAGLIAQGLTWGSWGSSTATGTGTGVAKVCEPDCASGKVVRAEIRLTLSRPQLCGADGKRHFTKIRYVWVDGAPVKGQPAQGTIPMPCSS
jgi:hypothetical protein